MIVPQEESSWISNVAAVACHCHFVGYCIPEQAAMSSAGSQMRSLVHALVHHSTKLLKS